MNDYISKRDRRPSIGTTGDLSSTEHAWERRPDEISSCFNQERRTSPMNTTEMSRFSSTYIKSMFQPVST